MLETEARKKKCPFIVGKYTSCGTAKPINCNTTSCMAWTFKAIYSNTEMNVVYIPKLESYSKTEGYCKLIGETK
jgi:hypothetical protein